MPEKVPAKNEFSLFLFITQPKKEPKPATSTITPTAIDKYFSDKFKSSNRPIGPPTNLPTIRGLTFERSTLSFSLKNTLKAIGSPNKANNWGTRFGLIWTIIGDAITANPKPRTPCTAELTKRSKAIKITSKRVKSNGKLNQVLLQLT